MSEEDYPPVPPIPKEFWEDEGWAYDNYNELVRMYPNQWVAIVNKQVVAAGKDGTEVVAMAKQKTGKRNFPVIFVEKGVRVYFEDVLTTAKLVTDYKSSIAYLEI